MSDIQTRIAAIMADKKNTRLSLTTSLVERNDQLAAARDHYRALRDENRALRAQLLATQPVARPAKPAPITTKTFFTKADGSRWVKVRTGNIAVTRPATAEEVAA